MNMFVQVIFAVVLLISATVEGGKGGVTIWMDKVTMTCPESGIWFKENKKEGDVEGKTHQYEYTGGKDNYYCKYSIDNEENSYYFYIQGNTCPNCVELDALLFAGVIVADVIGTAILMVIIYKCTKKKATGGPQHGPNSPRSRLQADTDTDPYARLSPRTASQDTYSMINRTG